MSNSGFEQNQFQRSNRNNFENNRSNSRNRFGGNKENSGFRIRLSENEMQAARVIQEKFQLKSTVAVLGFAVRTLSDLVKNEELKDTLNKYLVENKRFSSNSNLKVSESEEKASSPDPFARPVRDQTTKSTPKENESGDAN
tara:strand:+ start:287 stop:709 length:423 start_codon:yes stop_codon:yes gene_type:complete